MVMTPKMIASLVLTIALAVIMTLGAQTIWGWRKAAMQNEQRGATMATTSGILKDGEASEKENTKREVGVDSARQSYRQGVEEARDEDQTVRDFGDAAVPDRLRLLACERRRARDRLGGAAVDRREAGQAEDCARFRDPR